MAALENSFLLMLHVSDVFLGLSWLVEHLVGSILMERPWRSLWGVCLIHIAMSWMLPRLTSTCLWKRSALSAETISTNLLYNFLMSFTTICLYMIYTQDSYGRYLKSSVFKDTQKKAVAPEPHRFRLVLKLKTGRIIYIFLNTGMVSVPTNTSRMLMS